MTPEEQARHMRRTVNSTLGMLDVYRYHVRKLEAALASPLDVTSKVGIALGLIDALGELDPGLQTIDSNNQDTETS